MRIIMTGNEMISNEEVQKIARLARLALTPEEAASLTKDLNSILGYVGELAAVNLPPLSTELKATNVLRPDTTPHEPGAYTKELLAAAFQTHDNFVEVKAILSDSTN